VTKPGDLWVLGEHRLLCGDATSPADLAKLMDGAVARMCFTDPPWNVAIGGDNNPRHRQRQGLKNDDLPAADFRAMLDGFARNLRTHVSGDVYVVLGASEWPTLDLALRDAGYHWSATVIWAKDAFVLGRSKYHRRYEPIWYGWHRQGKSSFCDRRDLDDVWEIPRPKRSELHPTTKPVALVARAIANSSVRGNAVVDCFGGSGTTLIAAEQTGRAAHLMELDPLYCDVIARRWEEFTGKCGVLDRAGASVAPSAVGPEGVR
jgi:DNA modification methylase